MAHRRVVSGLVAALVGLIAPLAVSASTFLPVVSRSHSGSVPTSTAPAITATPTSMPAVTPTATTQPTGDPLIDSLDGSAILYSHDATTFLGLVSSSCFDADSIVNRFGNYGSPYSATSISNEFGDYGSPYSNKSAFNQYASGPPVILVPSGTRYVFFAYLTVNPYMAPGINSAYLLTYLRAKSGCH